ncbi:MAG: DUF1576 domain-containing protein [Clostridium sp.]
MEESMNRFGIQRPLSKKKCFLILSLLPLYFIVVGLFMQPVDQIFHGIVEIIREPDFLITDYFVIGGVGAAFINAGVLTPICIGIMYALDMNFDGTYRYIYLPDVWFLPVRKKSVETSA